MFQYGFSGQMLLNINLLIVCVFQYLPNMPVYPPMARALHWFQKLRLRLEQVSDIIPYLEYP